RNPAAKLANRPPIAAQRPVRAENSCMDGAETARPFELLNMGIANNPAPPAKRGDSEGLNGSSACVSRFQQSAPPPVRESQGQFRRNPGGGLSCRRRTLCPGTTHLWTPRQVQAVLGALGRGRGAVLSSRKAHRFSV